MKKYILVMILCGALPHSLVYAESADRATGPVGSHAKAGPVHADDGSPLGHHSPGVAKTIHPALAKSVAKTASSYSKFVIAHNAFKAGAKPSLDFHSPGLGKYTFAPRKVVAVNKIENNHNFAARPLGTIPLAGSSVKTTHTHPSELAVLGGLPIRSVKTTAVINGTGLRNRAY